MFRRYIAAAAALMMLISTQQASFATDQAADSTMQHSSTTNTVLNATLGQVFSTKENTVPTGFPPGASNLPLVQHHAAWLSSSTGHDYTTQSVSMQEQKMMNLLNQDRKNNGLPALTPDPELSRIARIKSEDMRDRDYFAHESPTYGDVRAMLRSFGYAFTGASENIAHHANVDKAQAAFMSSAGHRRNILSPVWTKVGIGICYDRNGYIYATQIFAR